VIVYKPASIMKLHGVRVCQDMMLSVIDIEPSPCSAPDSLIRKRVRFCADHPVTEVLDVTHEYPHHYFYTSYDMKR